MDAPRNPRSRKHLTDPEYQPDRLLNTLIATQGLKNDARLAEYLKIGQDIISKIRHRDNVVSKELLLDIHERFGIPVSDLRVLVGIKSKFE